MQSNNAAAARDPRIEALIAKAEAATWPADDAAFWSSRAVRPRHISRAKYRAMVSQIYHGECTTLAVCKRLSDEIPDPLAARFLALQADEERRHAQMFERYLEPLGGIAPVDPGLGGAFARTLSWDGPWQAVAVAVNVILEAETIRLLLRSPHLFSCPKLRTIIDVVTRDEARHLAFGRLFIAPHLAALSVEERRRIYLWVLSLWRECIYTPRGGVLALVLRFKRRRLRRLWDGHNAAMCDIGLVSEGETVAA
ncbi:MAG: ferritin-like domain-containing protein [Proteobacteria bacterium]|nr:ferritin-like domain-containing protein [Pseudomonadota bacterium]